MMESVEPLNVRQVVFTNLKLLGFDSHAMERKHRIPFNRDMFKLPNKKGFEVVMHFLFVKLNPATAKEEFRDCWPVRDKKEEQQFRRATNNWLINIAKDDPDAHFPRVVASLFMSPGGDRFYQLLLAVTRYILHKLTGMGSNDIVQFPVLTSQNHAVFDCMSRVLKCSTARLRKTFLNVSQQSVAVQNEWKNYASELVKENRGLSKAIRETERLKRVELQRAVENGPSIGSPVPKHRARHADYAFDIQTVERAQRVQRVRDMWKSVDDFYSSQTDEREVVESILRGTLDKHKLDASSLNITVPDRLLTECEKQIQARNIQNVYQGGKLNLLSVLQLWNLCLHLYIEKLHQDALQDFDEEVGSITKQVHRHNANLTQAQALGSKLDKEILPNLKKSVDELKESFCSGQTHPLTPRSVHTTSLGLGLQPLTPPVAFTDSPGHMTDASLKASTCINSALTPNKVNTPDAVSRVLDSVGEMAQNRLSSLVQGSPGYIPKMAVSGQPYATNSILSSKVPKLKSSLHTDLMNSKPRTRIMSAPCFPSSKAGVSSSRNPAPHQQDNGMRVGIKETPSGTVLTQTPRELPASARGKLKEQKQAGQQPMKAQHFQPTTTDQDFKAPLSNKKVVKRSKKVTPRVKRHVGVSATAPRPTAEPSRSNRGVSTTPRAHQILIDQIVDAVTNAHDDGSHQSRPSLSPQRSPQSLFLSDPTSAFNDDAFKSREKLKHSPIGSYGSTGESVSRKNPKAEQMLDHLATKLFMEEIGKENRSPKADTVQVRRENGRSFLSSQSSVESIDDKYNSPESSATTSQTQWPDHIHSGHQDSDQVLSLKSLESEAAKLLMQSHFEEKGLPNFDLVDPGYSNRENGIALDCIDNILLDNEMKSPVFDSSEFTLQDTNTDYLLSETPCLPTRSKKINSQSTFVEERLFEFGEDQLLDLNSDLSSHNNEADLSISGTRLIVVTTPAKKSRTVIAEQGEEKDEQQDQSLPRSCSSVESGITETVPQHLVQFGTTQDTTGKDLSLAKTLSESSADPTSSKTSQSSIDSVSTNDLIARYRKLKLTSSTEQTVMKQADDNISAPMFDEKYLIPSPSRGSDYATVRAPVQRFSLDLQTVSPTPPGGRISPELGYDDYSSVNQNIPSVTTPVKSAWDAADDVGVLVEFTPMRTPQKSVIKNQMDLKSPLLTLSSMPMSPTTSFLHGGKMSVMQEKLDLFENILDEDESLLIPNSPDFSQRQSISPESSSVGRLLDL